MTIINQKQGLTGAVEYNTDLWRAATISRLLKNFETLLTHVLADPDARLSDLKESLHEAEQQRQLQEQEAAKNARLKKLSSIRLSVSK
jgi:non-ribosomal peptide synthetase component F